MSHAAFILVGVIAGCALWTMSRPVEEAFTEESSMIKRLIDNTNRLVAYLKETYPNDPRTKRLTSRWKGKLLMLDPKHSQAGKTIDKKTIYICIKDTSGKLYDDNTAQFVLIHELAHMANDKYGHDDAFWKTMKFLLHAATHMPDRIYTFEKYESFPTNYCGQAITGNPYTDCHENKKCELF